MKKIFTNLCGIIVVLGLSCSAFAIDATPIASAVLVDGKAITFEAFNINGNNYFKLRDIAYVLNGSDSQFSVGYDATTDTIYLTSGQPYITAGNELQKNIADALEVTPANSTVIKDGQNINIAAYNVNGSNYFKLRDIGKEIDFKVDYNAQTNSVLVETKKKTEEKSSNLDENGLATDILTTWEPPEPIPAN